MILKGYLTEIIATSIMHIDEPAILSALTKTIIEFQKYHHKLISDSNKRNECFTEFSTPKNVERLLSRSYTTRQIVTV